MRRVVVAIVVALLTFSASGVSALIIAEPCTGYEQPGHVDRSCPPTCVTCGCCAQAAEPMMLHLTNSPDEPALETDAFIPRFPKSRAHDILHVPKTSIA